MRTTSATRAPAEAGATLIELMIALVVLTLGILAMGQLFPAGSRRQLQSRMTTNASYHTQETIEQLAGQSWTGAALTVGRHPASGYDTLGSSGRWRRFYQVSSMSAPLDNLKKVTVSVQWSYLGARTVTATTYVRR
jgi:Tfp pilus assembly protein PilV